MESTETLYQRRLHTAKRRSVAGRPVQVVLWASHLKALSLKDPYCHPSINTVVRASGCEARAPGFQGQKVSWSISGSALVCHQLPRSSHRLPPFWFSVCRRWVGVSVLMSPCHPHASLEDLVGLREQWKPPTVVWRCQP